MYVPKSVILPSIYSVGILHGYVPLLVYRRSDICFRMYIFCFLYDFSLRSSDAGNYPTQLKLVYYSDSFNARTLELLSAYLCCFRFIAGFYN